MNSCVRVSIVPSIVEMVSLHANGTIHISRTQCAQGLGQTLHAGPCHNGVSLNTTETPPHLSHGPECPHPKALPHAVANSFIEMMQQQDADFIITHPVGYELDPEIVGATQVEHDQDKAFEGADYIYTKNWSSFSNYGKVLIKDPSWMISAKKMALTNKAKFMHCLPVRRNVVVEDAVLDHQDSLVIDQANNRTYAAQIVLKKILEKIGK